MQLNVGLVELIEELVTTLWFGGQPEFVVGSEVPRRGVFNALLGVKLIAGADTVPVASRFPAANVLAVPRPSLGST
jgi:hypothetical protein